MYFALKCLDLPPKFFNTKSIVLDYILIMITFLVTAPPAKAKGLLGGGYPEKAAPISEY